MQPNLPDIFHYIDFKKYLQDYYQAKKRADRGFTHTYICHRLGQKNAKSYFNNVVMGRLPITPTFVDRFISLIELKSDEAKFFRALVNYNQTKSPNEKEFFFDQLVRLNKTPYSIIDKNAYAYFKQWHHSAVRALLDVVDFKDNYVVLTSRLSPKITVKEARNSITFLKQHGLIRPDARGFWKATEKVIATGDLIRDAMVKQFQMKCLDLAKTAIADDSLQQNRNVTMTVSLSKKACERISERIKQFKLEIRSIVHKDEFRPDGVYHINMNFFPMTSRG
jgi:uncharacterized protein (TIGR02147 family)